MEQRQVEPIIQLTDVRKIYKMGTQVVKALDGATITIYPNEYVAIMGPSGSGKSTMMNIIGALDIPTSGTYVLNGEDVSEMDDDELAGARNRQIVGGRYHKLKLITLDVSIRSVLGD